jgi:hypothetical protein
VTVQKTCPVSAAVPLAGLPSPNASEAAFLAANNQTVAGLESLNDQQLAALQQASGVSTSEVQQKSSGQSACISYVLPSPTPTATPVDPSWERTQLAGSYMLALSSNTDEVLNELSCAQSLTIDTSGACYVEAQQVLGLISTLQSAATQLGQAANIHDIDYCQASFGPVASASGTPSIANTATLTGNLRQSASFLCSARAKLEAAYGQLAVCDIFSRAQNDYLTKTGPALQPQFFSTMTQAMDSTCRAQCKSSTSIPSLQSCINQCYQQNVQSYFQTTMNSYWPQPTPLNSSCVVGGKVYGGN